MIYFSYSRKDKAIINRFVQQLRADGFSVWIDFDGIYSGEQFKGRIVKAIENSKVFLFFSSKSSNESPWTAREIAIAIDRHIPIIPIKLDNTKYNNDVEFDLINLNYVDLSNKPINEDSIQNIINSVEALRTNKKTTIVAEEKGIHYSFHPIIETAFSFQLIVFTMLFFTFSLALLSGCLAFYHNPQPSLFFLCIFLLISIISTYKIRTHRSLWIGIISASDFFIVLFLSTIAKYLYKNWFILSHQSEDLPYSIRYKLLYYLGKDITSHNFLGMHSYLVILAIIHILLMCLLLCIKKDGKSGWQIMQ